ncbi:MAG: VPLPA-CTERM sorting domain-containing protein [Acidiferrobacterales bacterium]
MESVKSINNTEWGEIMKPIVACCASLALLLVATGASANPLTGTMLINPGIYDVNGNYVSGSYFSFGGPAAGVGLTPTVSPDPGGIVLGSYQNFVLNPNVPHPYNWDGKGASAGTGYSASPTVLASIVQPFIFAGDATYVGTNPISYQSGNSYAAPTADLSNCVGNSCTLSVDLSSWEVMWNGSAFQQGPRPVNTGPFVPAVGTYDTGTHAYSLTWTSQISGGPFNGVTGHWHIDGVVSTVPLPASIWMLGSGLIGLLALFRTGSRKGSRETHC